MAKKISSTEAARQFSDLLNRVRFRGERYTVVRGGKAVASIGPITAPAKRTLGELPALLKQLPLLGDEQATFARDVRKSIRRAPALPRKSSWA